MDYLKFSDQKYNKKENRKKIFIFAIDCLDYRLIDKFNLNGFRQLTHGTIDVSEFGGERCLTPAIWGSMIRGKKLKTLEWYVYDNKFLQITMDLLKNIGLRRYVEYIFQILKIKNKFKSHLITKSDVKYKTIFDIISPSIALYVPTYNDEEKYHKEYDLALKKGTSNLEKKVLEVHKIKYQMTKKEIKKDWDLFMVWFDVIDMFSHMYYPENIIKLEKIYNLVYRQVEEINSLLSENTITFIISDHGINERKFHNPVAFWSVNVEKISFMPKKITELFNLILTLYKDNIQPKKIEYNYDESEKKRIKAIIQRLNKSNKL